MQTTAALAAQLLVLLFKASRRQSRLNLAAIGHRRGSSLADLQAALDLLAERNLIAFGPAGERLTLSGLALAATLARTTAARQRPLAWCRRDAA